MMTTAISFSILDVPFRVVGTPDDLAYIHAFANAYEDMAGAPMRTPITVSVERASVPTAPTATSCWVHRSKHHYWNIRGIEYAPDAVRWLNRPVWTHCPSDHDVIVTTAPTVSPAMAGEAAWHVCRNLALYHRDPRNAMLLHASAVTLHNRGIIFLGAVSAGKTTFMTEAVITHGATPLANDRVLVGLGAPLMLTSWPSYASFTEGTLLDYELLRHAALDYENGCFPYRTQTWGTTFSRRYTKDAKRIYPMHWFTVASSRRYRRHAQLGALVLSQLSPNIAVPSVTRVSLNDETNREHLVTLLQQECFDAREPSFQAWHGLPLPHGSADAATLVAALASQTVPVYRLVAPAPGFRSALDDLLGMLS
jgi:hypothetical protein